MLTNSIFNNTFICTNDKCGFPYIYKQLDGLQATNNSFGLTSIQIINIDNNSLISHIVNQFFKEFSECCDKF